MAYYIAQVGLSFIASIGFGIIFNAPRKALFHCGLVGTGGWMIYLLMTDAGIDIIQASFGGAFVVGLIGHILAKYYKTPIITFIVAGIIPLVPGGTAYNAMRQVVSNNYAEAIPLATKAFIVASAIAMGLVFAEVLVQLTVKVTRRRGRKIES